MSKILFPVLLIAALVIPVLSCGGSQHSPDEKYFLIGTNVNVTYWKQIQAGLSKAASEMHVQAEMLGPEGHDPKAQREFFARAVARKPSGILVSASDPSLTGDIDAAVAQGIPVITIDSDAPDSKRLTFVGTDNYKAGVTAGNVVARRMKFRGAVTVITMPEQNNLKERLNGYTNAFESSPQIKITEIIDAKGDPQIVRKRISEMIDKNVRFEAVLCLISFACPEVADVLTGKNVQGKIVMAMDTDDRTLMGIQKGIITATIAQKPFTMAFRGLKMLDDVHHNPPVTLAKAWADDSFSPFPTFVDTGATLLDADNVDSFIVARNAKTKK